MGFKFKESYLKSPTLAVGIARSGGGGRVVED